MLQLKNKFLSAGFDEMGRIVELVNNTADYGNVIEYPAAGMFKMICKVGESWEGVVYPKEQEYKVYKKDDVVITEVSKVSIKEAKYDIKIIMKTWLEADKLKFEAGIENNSELMVTDFMYPRIGVIKSLGEGKPDLLWPHSVGIVFTDIGGHLAKKESPYEEYNMETLSYPSPASMQWMSLMDGDQTLYFGSHDREFYASVLRAIGRQEDAGSIILDIVKHVFVKPGENWKGQPFVVNLATKSWRYGADIYRKYLDTWLPKVDKPQWIKDMMGYFLVINKQQYGDIMWPYDTLPELWELAKEHGCDTLGLFGWYAGGHDNQYPNVLVDDLMGGEEELKENIEKVKNDGGNVTLYCQGHLIDITTDYYKETGHKLESKSLWGTPYFEQYNKFHESELLKHYTKKTFSTACPSCPEWHDRMCENAELLHGHGANGILMDQLGGMPPYPCFEESHPHEQGKPSLSFTCGRQQLIEKVHGYTQKLDPEFCFIIEHLTDMYTTYADAGHGLTFCYPGEKADRADYSLKKIKGTKKIPFGEMYRYTLPEVIYTVRNPAPYIKPEMANYAFVFGLRYEMELRYLGDQKAIRQDEYKEWKEYAKKVNDLKKSYWSLLGTGKFVDEEIFMNDNKAITGKAFISEDGKMAIALWNDSGEKQKVQIQAEGYTLIEAATIDGKLQEKPKQLENGQIAVLLYEKN